MHRGSVRQANSIMHNFIASRGRVKLVKQIHKPVPTFKLLRQTHLFYVSYPQQNRRLQAQCSSVKRDTCDGNICTTQFLLRPTQQDWFSSPLWSHTAVLLNWIEVYCTSIAFIIPTPCTCCSSWYTIQLQCTQTQFIIATTGAELWRLKRKKGKWTVLGRVAAFKMSTLQLHRRGSRSIKHPEWNPLQTHEARGWLQISNLKKKREGSMDSFNMWQWVMTFEYSLVNKNRWIHSGDTKLKRKIFNWHVQGVPHQ